MSRIVSGQVDEGALYEPDLFLQGIILVSAGLRTGLGCLGLLHNVSGW